MIIYLYKILTVIVLCLPAFGVYASWKINTEGQKGIYVINDSRHQFSIVENNGGVDFYLSLVDYPLPAEPDHAIIQAIDLKLNSGPLKLIDRHQGQSTYRIQLDRQQKSTLMNKMINGLFLDVMIATRAGNSGKIRFTLDGFTAIMNDFLIAREIGRLDYEWLLENHRDRELLCLYASNIYVKAILDRLANGSYRKTLDSIPKTGIEKLDSVTGEMVQNAYSIPERKLPRDPRGDKYGIFKACMSQAN